MAKTTVLKYVVGICATLLGLDAVIGGGGLLFGILALMVGLVLVAEAVGDGRPPR